MLSIIDIGHGLICFDPVRPCRRPHEGHFAFVLSGDACHPLFVRRIELQQGIHSRSHFRRQVIIGNRGNGQMTKVIPGQCARGQAEEKRGV